MLRGEIWQVEFDPAPGTETGRRRPAVVVSNDRADTMAVRIGRGVVTVVPLSSDTDTVDPFQVLLPAATTGLPVDAKAHAEQIRSVPAERLRRPIGRVAPAELAALDEALRLHLAL